ncbi:MAG: energy transducer TonB [Litorimonas sp.]
MRVFVTSCIVALNLSLFSMAFAQTPWLNSHLIQYEKSFEASLQERLRDFRLMKRLGDFDERLNATEVVSVSSDSVGGIVGLHDIRTGEPLESCQSPCELHIDTTRRYMLVYYKRGYYPDYFFLENGELTKDVSLGHNYINIYRQHRKCWRDFKASEKIDRDAIPCVRIQPKFPKFIDRSGHCEMIFDVSEGGRPINIRTKSCSDPRFERTTIQTIRWWFYDPKVERGSAVMRPNVETKMVFQLMGLGGKILDENGEPVSGSTQAN